MTVLTKKDFQGRRLEDPSVVATLREEIDGMGYKDQVDSYEEFNAFYQTQLAGALKAGGYFQKMKSDGMKPEDAKREVKTNADYYKLFVGLDEIEAHFTDTEEMKKAGYEKDEIIKRLEKKAREVEKSYQDLKEENAEMKAERKPDERGDHVRKILADGVKGVFGFRDSEKADLGAKYILDVLGLYGIDPTKDRRYSTERMRKLRAFGDEGKKDRLALQRKKKADKVLEKGQTTLDKQ
jgi:hypothetical protein